MSDKAYKMKQFRRAMRLFAQTVTDESVMMEIADVYPKWSGGFKSYKTGTILAFGKNADGETQLYQVLQDHTSRKEWTPAIATSLYKKIGFTDSGVPIWTQPLGSTDAYMMGDRVMDEGTLWESEIDGNVWKPGVYGWKVVE